MKKINETDLLNLDSILDFFNISKDIIQSISSKRDINIFVVNVKLNVTQHICPDCGAITTNIKDYKVKTIKHSILHSTPCYIKYNARRYICKTCKKSFYENNPFASKDAKLSLGTVINVLYDLKKENETFTSVASRYFISVPTVTNIFDKHVSISRRKMPEILCIDEVYAFKSYRSKYVCVFLDFKSQKVVDILPSRQKYNLLDYFQYIPRAERENVKFISIDMWETYRIVSKIIFPKAKLIVDKFHCIQELSKNMMKIYSRVLNQIKVPNNIKYDELTNEGKRKIDERKKQYAILKKYHMLLFKATPPNPNDTKYFNKVLNRFCNSYDYYSYILDIHSDLNTMNNLHYHILDFFKRCNHKFAKERLEEIITNLRNSDISEMNDYANTLVRWKNEIINSFIVIGKKQIEVTNKETGEVSFKTVGVKVTNGIIESRNKAIKTIKRNSNGYRNWHRFRNRVLYVLNDDTTFMMIPKYKEKESQKRKQ